MNITQSYTIVILLFYILYGLLNEQIIIKKEKKELTLKKI